MAASTETVAFIAAGGAIVGSLVGSTVGGIMDAVLDRVREGRRARVGARLVRVDLAMAASRLKAMEESQRWWSFQRLSMNSWGLYEDALTARLDPESLITVTQAVVGLRVVSGEMQMAFTSLSRPMQSVDTTESTDEVRGFREQATAAYNALAKLAGEQTVAGLLPED